MSQVSAVASTSPAVFLNAMELNEDINFYFKACTNCRHSHVACDHTRPCRRCIKASLVHSCMDKFAQSARDSMEWSTQEVKDWMKVRTYFLDKKEEAEAVAAAHNSFTTVQQQEEDENDNESVLYDEEELMPAGTTARTKKTYSKRRRDWENRLSATPSQSYNASNLPSNSSKFNPPFVSRNLPPSYLIRGENNSFQHPSSNHYRHNSNFIDTYQQEQQAQHQATIENERKQRATEEKQRRRFFRRSLYWNPSNIVFWPLGYRYDEEFLEPEISKLF